MITAILTGSKGPPDSRRVAECSLIKQACRKAYNIVAEALQQLQEQIMVQESRVERIS